ncbi:MAG: hypothetical protein Q9160_007884 [Pyrenula sp. 1 TL-2023]
MKSTTAHINSAHYASILAGRAATAEEETNWRLSHSPSTWSYTSTTHTLSSEIAPGVSVEIYHPIPAPPFDLPLVFVTHGGGFLRGSPTTEERWFLAPLFSDPTMPRAVIANVSYRLAPETPFPVPGEDCWAALKWCVAHTAELKVDVRRIILAGSSSGAALAAGLSQRVRDEGFNQVDNDERSARVTGVALNVPVLCHPKFFPERTLGAETWSFEKFKDGSLSAEIMWNVWEIYLRDQKLGSDIRALLCLTSGTTFDRLSVGYSVHLDGWEWNDECCDCV